MQFKIYNLLDQFLETLEFTPYTESLHTLDTLSEQERKWLISILNDRYGESTNVTIEEV